MKKYYKLLNDNKANNGGNFDYSEYIKTKNWLPRIEDTIVCKKGYHVTTVPNKWLDSNNQLFIVDVNVKDIQSTEDDKVVVSTFRFVKELNPKEIKKVLKENLKIKSVAMFAKEFPDALPTKKAVVEMYSRILKINWFKPQNKINKVAVQCKVNSILQAFHLKVKAKVQWNQLNKKEDWDSARDSARDSAWDSARDSARDFAWASAWDSARDSACDSARDSAWFSAWDSAWFSARDSARDSAWFSAWFSARDSAWFSD